MRKAKQVSGVIRSVAVNYVLFTTKRTNFKKTLVTDHLLLSSLVNFIFFSYMTVINLYSASQIYSGSTMKTPITNMFFFCVSLLFTTKKKKNLFHHTVFP